MLARSSGTTVFGVFGFAAGFFFTVFLATPNHSRVGQGGATPAKYIEAKWSAVGIDSSFVYGTIKKANVFPAVG